MLLFVFWRFGATHSVNLPQVSTDFGADPRRLAFDGNTRALSFLANTRTLSFIPNTRRLTFQDQDE